MDLLAGEFTGVMVRLTFAPTGEILLIDSAHACGCYHLFFPSDHAPLRPVPDPIEEWALVPAALPRIEAGHRLRFWVASRTHYLTRRDTAELTETASKFSLRNN